MRRNDVLLSISAALSLIAAFCFSHSTFVNLLSGYFISVFFYFLVVRIPERKRHLRLLRNIQDSYDYLKHQLLYVILSATDDTFNIKTIERLKEPKEFEEYFSGQKWYDFLNNLDSEGIDKIKHHVEVFRGNLIVFSSSVNIDDDDVYKKMNNISIWISQMQIRKDNDDGVKSWGRFLWELFAKWDPIVGYHNVGLIDDIISTLKRRA